MAATSPRWEHFAHGADIGIRGVGPSKAHAFTQAACALTAVVTDLKQVTPRASITIHCHAPDDELLLLDWLNALIYEMAVRRMVFSEFAVTLHGHQLDAQVRGERTSARRHQPAVELKGATLAAIRVQPVAGGWLAQTVVDV